MWLNNRAIDVSQSIYKRLYQMVCDHCLFSDFLFFFLISTYKFSIDLVRTMTMLQLNCQQKVLCNYSLVHVFFVILFACNHEMLTQLQTSILKRWTKNWLERSFWMNFSVSPKFRKFIYLNFHHRKVIFVQGKLNLKTLEFGLTLLKWIFLVSSPQ